MVAFQRTVFNIKCVWRKIIAASAVLGRGDVIRLKLLVQHAKIRVLGKCINHLGASKFRPAHFGAHVANEHTYVFKQNYFQDKEQFAIIIRRFPNLFRTMSENLRFSYKSRTCSGH